jgi:hypothetical protein
MSINEKNIQEVLDNLQNSGFRCRVKLHKKEAEYLNSKGLETVLKHAAGFIEKRLAPAEPVNDGKQTPWRNHPVFTAQHATVNLLSQMPWKNGTTFQKGAG